jgi:hypothetical protein
VSPYAINYCIATGSCNGVATVSGVFVRLERVVTGFTGASCRDRTRESSTGPAWNRSAARVRSRGFPEAYRVPHTPPARGHRDAVRKWLPYLIAVLAFLFCIGRVYDKRNGFTKLIGFGSRFASHTVPVVRSLPRYIYRRSAGYDGQFYAQLATDPLMKDSLTDQAMDDMPLRARRIFFAWTAYVLGLGRPAWILQAYALQNVICWLVLSVLLLRWFPAGTPRMSLRPRTVGATSAPSFLGVSIS